MRGKFLYLVIVGVIFLILFSLNFSKAKEEKLTVYLFWGEGCPHCAREIKFLEKLKTKYPEVKFEYFEVWHNQENLNLLAQIGKKLNIDIQGVPFTLIGQEYISGYFNDEITGKLIEEKINQCLTEKNCPDLVKIINQKEQEAKQNFSTSSLSFDFVKLPFLGKINLKDLSLPALTVIFGLLDGFNPCAMWILVFLITLVMPMKERKKAWILGITFLSVSGLFYFLFMSAWLNFLLFLGFLIWVRILIGLVALSAGIHNLREYFKKQLICKISQRGKTIFEKLKNLAQREKFILALGGVILLAFFVNLIEFICSAGLPVVYSQILVLNQLAKWQYYLYLALYTFFYMLDDLIVFSSFMLALGIFKITEKYTKLSHLIGGVIMIIIGLLLIFKPEWLMFG